MQIKEQFTPVVGRLNAECQLIPLYGSVSAGFPSPAEDYMEGKLDLNTYLIPHPAATFFVRVEGVSMTGAGIFPEDLLIVDRSLSPKNGTVIVAILEGEFTVKRWMQAGGRTWLQAEHPSYKPIKLDEFSDFRVWGVVTHVIHRPSD